MSGRRITELAAATAVTRDDVLPVVDLSGTPTTKKLTAGTLIASLPYLIQINARVASYVLTADDAGKAVEMDVGSANTVTVPPNSAVPFPIGTTILVTQLGVGATSIVEGSGVTVATPDTLDLAGQGHTVMLRKRATNGWVMAWVGGGGGDSLPDGASWVFWFDAGGDADAARPAGAGADDIVIWTNVPSEPTNLGARDQWEDAS